MGVGADAELSQFSGVCRQTTESAGRPETRMLADAVKVSAP